MKMRRVSHGRQVKIARQTPGLNTGKAMEILKGYGKTLSDKLLGAMKELDREKQASLMALKDVGADVRAQVMEKYDNIDKSMGYLGSIADLLVVNDPQRWLEAKTTGIFRKKYDIGNGGQTEGAPKASQGADVTTPPPATTAPQKKLEVRPPRKDMVPGEGQDAAPGRDMAKSLDGGVKLTTEDFDVALKSARDEALNNKMVFLSNIQNHIHAVNDAVRDKRPEEEQFKMLLKHYRGIGKLIAFVSSYNPSTNKRLDSVDRTYYHLTPKQIQKTVDRYFSTMDERLAESRLSFIDFIKEIVKKAEAIIAANEYDKVRKQIIVAQNNPTEVLKDEFGTVRSIHDKFLAHMKGVGQHIAGVFKGVSQYATRPEVEGDKNLSSMLSTVTNTLRWSASLVANAINENEDSKKFWDAAMKDGLRMMEAEKVKGLVGEVDPDDILKDALEMAAKEEALKLTPEPPAEEKATETKPDVKPTVPPSAEEKGLPLTEDAKKDGRSLEDQLAEIPMASMASPAGQKKANELARKILGLKEGDYVKVVPGLAVSYPGAYELRSFNEDGTAELVEVGGKKSMPGVPLYSNVNGKLVTAWQKLSEEEKGKLQPSVVAPEQVAEEAKPVTPEESTPSALSQSPEATLEQPVQEPPVASVSETYIPSGHSANPAWNDAVAKVNVLLKENGQGTLKSEGGELEALYHLLSRPKNIGPDGLVLPQVVQSFAKLVTERMRKEESPVQASASFIRMVNAHLECGGNTPLLDGERMSMELAISEGHIGISSVSSSGLRSLAESVASKVISGRAKR